MKSMTLNERVRSKILRKAVEVKFKKELDKKAKAKARLGKLLYNHFYPPEAVQALELVANRVRVMTTAYLLLGSAEIRYLLGTDDRRYRKMINLPLDGEEEGYVISHSLDVKDFERIPLNPKQQKEAAKILTDVCNLQDTVDRFSCGLEDLLKSVKTTKQLVELLPEAKAWLPPNEGCTNIPSADKAAALRKMM